MSKTKVCGSCGGSGGFKDLPLDYVATRWPGCDWTGDALVRTQCKLCGATFATVVIDESAREGAD